MKGLVNNLKTMAFRSGMHFAILPEEILILDGLVNRKRWGSSLSILPEALPNKMAILNQTLIGYMSCSTMEIFCLFEKQLTVESTNTAMLLKLPCPVKIQALFNIFLGREKEASYLQCKNLVKCASLHTGIISTRLS